MMRRFLTCILTLAALLALAAPARMDVLWEPIDNPFYDRHRKECSVEQRTYCANSPEGFVTAWDAPDGSQARGQYENGTNLWVAFLYQDWGLISQWEDGEEITGWVPLAELSLVYDYISFEEEYGDRITDYNGEFDRYSGEIDHYNGETEEVNFYMYPGAPEISQSFTLSDGWGGGVLEELTGSWDRPSYISSIFVDEDGRTWGFVGYMYGRLNAWFCLDEPDGTNFPVRQVAQAEITPAKPPELPAQSYIPYILVAGVVVITAFLLWKFWRKKK